MASTKQYKAIGEDIWRNRTEKINAELFSLTYGALVVQLIKDYEDYEEVNKQLDRMGYNIGTRLIEDFLARTSMPRCGDFREVAEVIAKVGFKSFLNITPTITFPPTPPTQPTASTSTQPNPPPASGATSSFASNGPTEFILTFDENPLSEFVELPADAFGRAKTGEEVSGSGGGKGGNGEGKRTYWNWGEIGGQEEGLWFSSVFCGVIRGCLEMISMQTETKFLSDTLRGDVSTDIHVKLIRIMDEEVPVDDE